MSFENLSVDGWEFGPLKEKIELDVGPAFQSHLFSEDGDATRLLRGVNITRGHTRWGGDVEKKWKYMTQNLKRYLLKVGDVVIGMDGALIGKNFAAIEQSDLPCLLVQRVARLRATGNLHQRFLFHLISHSAFLRHIEKYKTHTAIPHMSSADINNYPIPNPPLAEQRRIAEILDTADEAIQKTEALIAKLKQMKAGLLHDLLTRGIDENGELRIHLGDEMPDGWRLEPLSTVSSKLITYGIVQPGEHQIGGVPFIQTKDLKLDWLDPQQMDRTSHAIAASYQRSAVRANDIVIGIRATVGDAVIVPNSLDGANISRGVARISPKPEYNVDYVLWALRSRRTQNALRHAIKGSTYAEVTLPALRNTEIPIAPRPEQDLIAERINTHESRITQESKTLDKLLKLKAGLMHDLLTGKKRVNQPAVATA